MMKIWLILLFSCGLSWTWAQDPRPPRPAEAAQSADNDISPAALTPAEKSWLADHPDIKFSAFLDQAPFVVRNPDGSLGGIMIDLFAHLSRAIGHEIGFEVAKTNEQHHSLSKSPGLYGNSAVIKTPQNESQYLMTEPYLVTPFFIFTTGDKLGEIQDDADLKGRKVAVMKGHRAQLQYLQDIGDVEVFTADSPLEQMRLVTSGQADALVGYMSYPYLINKYLMVDLAIAFVFKSDLGVRIGINPEHPMLLQILNKAIGVLDEDARQRVLAKWTDIARLDVPRELALSPEESAWLEAQPVLRVGVRGDWTPVEYLDASGALQGISADYRERLEKLLGVRLEPVHAGNWGQTLDLARKGGADLFLSLHPTPERREFLNFTESYLAMPMVIFTGPQAPYIGDLDELAGRRVAVAEGYAAQALLAANHPAIELIAAPDPETAVRLLASGEVYAFVGNILTAGHYIAKLGLTQLRVSGDTPYQYRQAFAARQDLPMLDRILHKALASIPQSDRQSMHQRWLTIRYDQAPDYALLWKILAAVALLFIVYTYWNRRLAAEVVRRRAAEERARSSAAQLSLAKEATDTANSELQQSVSVLNEGQQLGRIGGWSYDVASEAFWWTDELFVLHGLPIDRESAAVRDQVARSIEGYPEGDQELVRHCFRRAIDEGLPYDMEHRFTRYDGRRLWLRNVGKPILRHGKVAQVVGALIDISEQKRVQQELTAAKDAAEAANRAKSIFLANMSHELRTPLNAILGFSQLMARDASLGDLHRRQLNTINRSGEHLLAMINDVLDLSKIEAGKIELHPESVDLPGMLKDIGEMFRFRAREKSLAFGIDLDWTLPARARLDAGKLRQILINLLGNATKFTEHGEIRLRARANPGDAAQLCLEIEDTGIGIPHGQLDAIFQPFAQAGDSLVKRKGTGLGLAITYSFVELMGGGIEVRSTDGQGSLFRVTVPIEPLSAALSPSARTDSEPDSRVLRLAPEQPAWRILVVDDDAPNRALLKDLLTPMGFAVREAADGLEAVREFKDWNPELILLDMRMPVMDGYQAARTIRALPKGSQVKILALTASAFEEQRAEVLESGCDELMVKPFKTERVLRTMGRHLGAEYLYTSGPATPVDDVEALTAADLMRLPDPLFSRLQQAMLTLDTDALEQMDNEIRNLNPEIADSLKLLAENYQYDALQDLFEQAREDRAT